MKVSVWIPDKLLEELDEVVAETRLTRSAFLCNLISNRVQMKSAEKVNQPPHNVESTSQERWKFTPCKHGLNPKLCKDSKCRT